VRASPSFAWCEEKSADPNLRSRAPIHRYWPGSNAHHVRENRFRRRKRSSMQLINLPSICRLRPGQVAVQSTRGRAIHHHLASAHARCVSRIETRCAPAGFHLLVWRRHDTSALRTQHQGRDILPHAYGPYKKIWRHHGWNGVFSLLFSV
jgi:hypothetical protein